MGADRVGGHHRSIRTGKAGRGSADLYKETYKGRQKQFVTNL